MTVSVNYFGLQGFAFPWLSAVEEDPSVDGDYSPADILRYTLVSLGVLSLPDSGSWPAYVGGEPNTPDNVVTLRDTAGRDDGRHQYDGTRAEHFGVQVRIRGTTHPVAYAKANEIADSLDEDVIQVTVAIGSRIYLVESVSRTTAPISLEKDMPGSKRSLFTVNCVVTLKRLS